MSVLISTSAFAETCVVIKHHDFFADEIKVSCADGKYGDDTIGWIHESSKVQNLVNSISADPNMRSLGYFFQGDLLEVYSDQATSNICVAFLNKGADRASVKCGGSDSRNVDYTFPVADLANFVSTHGLQSLAANIISLDWFVVDQWAEQGTVSIYSRR